MKVADEQFVFKQLDMDSCIRLMGDAMRSVSKGQALNPVRSKLSIKGSDNTLLIMPASDSKLGVFGVKNIVQNSANSKRGIPTFNGIISLFKVETGVPIGIVDAPAITLLRTAAMSAVATEQLARHGAESLGILGTGPQSIAHAKSMICVRGIKKIRIWGRSFEKALAVVAKLRDLGVADLRAVHDPFDAATCDIVTTLTGSKTPILQGGWLRPGCHVNLVGNHSPTDREADSETVLGSRVFVDTFCGARSEAGELIIPLEAGETDQFPAAGEIGQVLNRDIPGRQHESEITVFKSLGIAVQDLYAANYVLVGPETT